MAPDPKRKRGRPANASKQATASTDKPDAYEADVEEAPPKKPGRPKRSIDAVEPAPAEEEQPRRKRGRPSLNPQPVPQNEPPNAPEEPAQPKRKRGRPSLEKQSKETEQVERSGDSAPRGAKNSRQGGQDEDVPEATQPRRRGRKPAQAQTQPEEEQQPEPPREPEAEPEAETVQPAQRKKRGRPSLQDLRNEEVQNKGSKAGKPKKTKQPPPPPETNAEDTENRDENEPKKRGRRPGARNSAGRKSDKATSRRQSGEGVPEEEVEENVEGEAEQEADGEEQPQDQDRQEDTTAPKRRGRRRSSQNQDAENEEDSAPPSPPKPYLHVASQTRRIRSSTITEKWAPLSGASFPAASTILSLAQQPVLQRTSTARNRRQHAEAAVQLVARRVARKLTRGLPFPPALSVGRNGRPGRPTADADGGRAAELDFESVLDGRNALERQLGPALHAVELLRRERDRMEKELERDYDKLRNLEASARAQTRERNERSKKAHVLAPSSRPTPQDAQDRSIITAEESGNIFKDLDDPDLNSLALQLSGHVDSIRNNLQQGEGITGQLTQSRAALQDVLMRYLDQNAYEQVIFG